MGNLQLRLPEKIHKTAKRYANKERTSLNQFIVTALSNEIIRHEALSFFEPIILRHNEDEFLKVLQKIPNVEPEKRDRI